MLSTSRLVRPATRHFLRARRIHRPSWTPTQTPSSVTFDVRQKHVTSISRCPVTMARYSVLIFYATMTTDFSTATLQHLRLLRPFGRFVGLLMHGILVANTRILTLQLGWCNRLLRQCRIRPSLSDRGNRPRQKRETTCMAENDYLPV